jgi:2,3-dihydroxybenzoate decarboxylase
MKRIAIEEHFFTAGYLTYLRSRKDYPRSETVKAENREMEWLRLAPGCSLPSPPHLQSGLLEVGEGRLKIMDEVGIDMQVLSLSFPGVEALDPSDATSMSKRVNDELFAVTQKYLGRFAGFAAIAPQNPDAAANELERAVKELGFKGAMVNSHTRGEYLDDRKYWVIFEKAEKLNVPIYIHPRQPSPDMIKPYLTYPELATPAWGFAAETGLHAMRLICSGLFDKYPGLKIILGHLGEALPWWLWRLDSRWIVVGREESAFGMLAKKKPSQYIKDNFYVTTSGMFWHPALQCCYSALGADRILFAVDHPYESDKEAVEFMDKASICDIDKEKIYHLNAEKLLGL